MSTDVDHIADHPDRLEEYVLGRLDEPLREAVAAHLPTCERCATAVQNEQLIVAGIRRAGRDAMKERLKAATGADNRSLKVTLPWSRIAGMAAGFVIIIGLGLAGRWWYSQQGGTSAVSPPVASSPAPQEAARPPENKPRETTPVSSSPAAAPGGGRVEVSKDIAVAERTESAKSSAAVQNELKGEANRTTERDALSKEMSAGALPQRIAAAPPTVGSLRFSRDHSETILGATPGHPLPLVIRVELPPSGVADEGQTVLAGISSLRAVSGAQAVDLTLRLSRRDSALLGVKPAARWVGSDSVVVMLGAREFGVKIPPGR
jgi:hypothetical protein